MAVWPGRQGPRDAFTGGNGAPMQETQLSNNPPPEPAGQQDAHMHALMKYYEDVLTKSPDHLETMFILGTLYARHGSPERAIPMLRRVLAHNPENAEGFHTLGRALRETGHMREATAAFRQAATLRPYYRAALVDLGDALAKSGDQTGAVGCYQRILALDGHNREITRYRDILAANPRDVATLIDLGRTFRAIGRHGEAAGRFELALRYAPDNIEAAMGLGAALTELGRVNDAVACYQTLLARHPDCYTGHMKLGRLLHQHRHVNEAISHFEKACALKPDEAPAQAALAAALQEIGRIGEAAACFRRAISLAPECTRYYQCLTRITRLAADDPVLPALRRLDADTTLPLSDQERADIHFALGKALSDMGEHQQSFAHLLKGNALHRRHITYDEGRMDVGMRRTRDLFTAGEIERLSRDGDPSPQPVFIVGMPRSGSTLVEQILASHPGVYAAGEVSTLLDTFRDAAARFPAWRTVSPLGKLTHEERRFIASDYLRRLNALVTDWPGQGAPLRITNKTLGNYLYIGMIRQLWPNARIIHTMRDPVDTCLSCFATPFNAQEFTFDLGELGRRYRQYHDLMAHWRHVLPQGAMLDVRYEDVVDDLEVSARRIIAYCGLPWDDACLDFYRSTRPVRTSSVEQVRNPIYRTAIGRWRPDAATLRPLLEGLGDLA